jgi:DNA repair protein RadD
VAEGNPPRPDAGFGKTVVISEMTRRAVANGKRVLFLAHRRRLIDQTSETFTAFGIPHGILMAGTGVERQYPVQICSRDTFLSRVVRNEWMDRPPADLVFLDEAHRSMADEYQKILALYPDAYHVGTTATPARDDGRGLGDFYQGLVCAPPISWLVENGRLVPVRCFAPQSFSKRSASRRKLMGDPVSTWKRLAAGRPTILFAGKVRQSMAMAREFNSAGISAEHIDAHTPDDKREAVIARVEAGFTQVLCNCSVLTEGVDIPALSCCILLRLCKSYVTFIQAVGRIMRPHPGKAEAILLDHSDAVLEHGLPTEDVRWELSESETVDDRIKKDRKDGKRKRWIACPHCGSYYQGSIVCPHCGMRLPEKLMTPEVKARLLREVFQAMTPAQKFKMQKNYWFMCLAKAYKSDQKVAIAAVMFRSRFRVWPTDVAGLTPMPVGEQWKWPTRELFPWLDKSRENGG